MLTYNKEMEGISLNDIIDILNKLNEEQLNYIKKLLQHLFED